MVYNTARHPEALRSVPGARAVCGSMPSGLGRRHSHGSLTAYRNHARWAHETDSWRRCTLRASQRCLAWRIDELRHVLHGRGRGWYMRLVRQIATRPRVVACGVQGPMICNLRCVCAGVAWPCALRRLRGLVSLHSAGGQAGGCARPACARCVGGALRLAKPLVCAPRRVGPARSTAPVFRGSDLRLRFPLFSFLFFGVFVSFFWFL